MIVARKLTRLLMSRHVALPVALALMIAPAASIIEAGPAAATATSSSTAVTLSSATSPTPSSSLTAYAGQTVTAHVVVTLTGTSLVPSDGTVSVADSNASACATFSLNSISPTSNSGSTEVYNFTCTFVESTIGTYTVIATFNGDTTNSATSSSSVNETTASLVVDKTLASTAISLTSSTVAAGQAEQATVTVTLESNTTLAASTITTTVSDSNNVQICQVELTNGTTPATNVTWTHSTSGPPYVDTYVLHCSFNEPTPGSYTVTASSSNDGANGSGASSASTPLTVTSPTTSSQTSLALSANPATTKQDLTGTVTVTIPYAGQPLTQSNGTVTVSDATTPTTFCVVNLATGTASSGVISSFSYVPGVAPAGDTYSFVCDNVSEGSPGVYSMTATFSGDTNNNAVASQTSANLTVNPSPTQTTLSLTPSSPTAGQPFSATATVSSMGPQNTDSPLGVVNVYNGSTFLCSVTVSATGSAQSSGTTGCSSLPAASYTITADYVPSTAQNEFASSTYNLTAVQVVQDSSTTSITVTPSPSNSPPSPTPGQSVTVTVLVAPGHSPSSLTPSGTVTVTDGTNQFCTVTLVNGSGSCTKTVVAKSYSLVASYPGDTNFTPSQSTPATTFTVSPIPTTTSLTLAPATTVSGQSVTASVSVSPILNPPGYPTGSVNVVNLTTSQTLCVVNLVDAQGSCTFTIVTPGTYSLQAQYGGDINYATSNSSPQSFTVTKAATQTVIAVQPNPTLHGETTTVSASVNVVAPGTGVPTGSVTVTNLPTGASLDPTVQSGCLLSSGTLTITLTNGSGYCSVLMLGPGTYQLTGTYSGDVNFLNSSDVTALAVHQDPTTTTVSLAYSGAPSNDPQSGEPITVSVTVASVAPGSGTPTGSVVVYSGGVKVCTITPIDNSGSGSCVITEKVPALYNVQATYQGDANYAVSTGTVNFVLDPAVTTTSVATAPLASSVSGQAIIIQATVHTSGPGVGLPTGTVTINDGVNTADTCNLTLVPYAPDGTGQTAYGSCTITETTPGAYTFTGTYSGATDFASSSGSTPHTVSKAQTTTVLTASSNASVSGQAVTVSAVVTSQLPGSGTPTGSIEVVDGVGSGQACAITLSGGRGSCTITETNPGAYSLSGFYSGDSNFVSSLGTTPLVVTSVKTTTSLTIVPTATSSGFVFSVKASVTPVAPGAGVPTGTVAVTDGVSGGQSCTITLSGGTGVCTITETTPGAYGFTGSYAGTTDFAASNTNMTVSTSTEPQATLSITETAGIAGRPLTLATSGGSGSGAVSYVVTDGGTAGCTVNGDVLSARQPGTCTVTATKSGDASYATATSAAATVTFVAAPVRPPRALRLSAPVVTGRRTVVTIIGEYFYGRPSITSSAPGTSVRVLGDTGHGLLVAVFVSARSPRGTHLLHLKFAHGQVTVVRYFQR